MEKKSDKRLTTEFLREYYQYIDEILNADRKSAEFRDVIAKLRETIFNFAILSIENDTLELYRRAENRYNHCLEIIDRELAEINQLINSFKTAETNAEIDRRIINLCDYVMDVNDYYYTKTQGYNDFPYPELRK